MEWSLDRPNTGDLWLRADASGSHVMRHWVTEAEDDKVLAGIGKGFYISWGDRLKDVSTLPEFYWYGPIPKAPSLEIESVGGLR